MKPILLTTDEKMADQVERKAIIEYGLFNVYRFQYRSNSGIFKYEILIKEV